MGSSPNEHPPVGLTDEDRDAWFKPGNDKIWGPDNWVRCDQCALDHQGRQVYHHKDAHGTS